MEKIKKPKNIKEWVDDNYKILTLIGIFIALISFFNNLYSSEKIETLFFLSFISFLIFLLFCIELWISFPRRDEPTSWRLATLEILFVFFFFSIIGYFLVTYKDLILKYLFIAFLPIYGIIAVKIIEKTKIYLLIRKTRNKKAENILSYLFVIIILIIIGYLSVLTQKLILYLIHGL